MAFVDRSLGEFLSLVRDPAPAPGGGAVAAITASLAAGLVAMASSEGSGDVAALGDRAAELADEDAAAYGAVIEARRAGVPVTDALTRATEVPLEIAETAAEIARRAAEVYLAGRSAVRGDAATALLLADGATRSAAHLVEVNVEAGGGSPDHIRRARAAAAAVARTMAGAEVSVTVER